jgi:hypothetical protein
MGYTIKNGETIGDAVLNSTGDIGNWDSILSANFFDSWTPTLTAGQVLQVAGTPNNQTLSDLTAYPANNNPLPGLFDQFYAIFTLLESATPIPSPNTLPVIDTNEYYIVRPLETIGDAVLNGSGNIANWSNILDANFFNTWTPLLVPNQKIAIPANVIMSLNDYRNLNTYPANNFSVPDIYDQIYAIFEEMGANNWILITNFWRDEGVWIDTAQWQD